MIPTCTETVSILYALIFGAGEACVRIDLASIMQAFSIFIIIVVIAQYVARRLWTKLSTPRERPIAIGRDQHPFTDDPNYEHSAIRRSNR